MKNILALAIVWLFISGRLSFSQEMAWEDISGGNHGISVVLVNPSDNNIIFASGAGNLFKSEDSGQSWRSVLNLRSQKRNFNALFIAPDSNLIFAATDDGLYYSENLGNRWTRIFKGKQDLEKQCTSVISTKQAIFVGTKAGVLVSWDKGRNWHKEQGVIGNNSVINIDASSRPNPVIYLAAVNGIFKSVDNGNGWERIFVNFTRENGDNSINEDGSSSIISDVNFVKAGNNNINLVYFATAKGVYKSTDQGANWKKLHEYGLLNRNILMLCLSENSQVLGLSESGVFSFDDLQWKELSAGLEAGKLNYLALDSKSNIYIAAEKGIFKTIKGNYPLMFNRSMLNDYLLNEPKINQVREAAIKYAEVSPEKIITWRKKAAKKALLPQVNVGLDRNSTDLWHWEGGSTTKEDDILRKGQDNIDWDVSLSWDFGDLIWNDAQTAIDVRSKLMVELWEDILDQVNKLYFERLRIKFELDNLAIEDRNKRFDKQLKLEELTASLDSLTAGYYSQQLSLLASKQPS
ncbi:MAG: hypothetical protein WC442_05005 [Candidatus Omnitrophota bacterium]